MIKINKFRNKIKNKKKTWNGLGILSQNITQNIFSYLRYK